MATAQMGTLLRHLQHLTADRCLPQESDRQLLDAFLSRRDEAAFAALVSRHGPMVLRVCRRVLRQEQDAEDAFQATFLVLAGKAGSIRKRDALADWLHGVAHRTAMKAKRSATRRRTREARRGADTPTQTSSPRWDDVQAILDEEIQRLPACYRAAFVLCVLEGKSGPNAAAELWCKEGTVKSQLSRARRRLQVQLRRRGIDLGILLAALTVAEGAGRAALPARLARATARIGLLVAAGELTDKATGKPLPGHRLTYFVRNGNPNQGDYAGFWGEFPGDVTTDENGNYRIIGLPGSGLLTVFQNHKEDYLFGAERDDEDGLKEDFGYMPQGNFAAFARIDPARGSESVRLDSALVRGWTFTGMLLGPDGKPLVGAVMGSEAKKTAEFTVRRFNPHRPRPVYFRHPGKGLVGVAQPPKEDGGSVTVRMGPGAAVTGRLVDRGEEARPGVELRVSFRPKGERPGMSRGCRRSGSRRIGRVGSASTPCCPASTTAWSPTIPPTASAPDGGPARRRTWVTCAHKGKRVDFFCGRRQERRGQREL